MTTKALFLDFDGPLIPVKARHLPLRQGKTAMDPCAASLIKHLLELDPNVKLVISSNHTFSGQDHCRDLLAANDIPWYVHPDWQTHKRFSSDRSYEIFDWLKRHPEITEWVAIDDISLDAELVPNFAHCDEFEGFSYRNFIECRFYLNLPRTNEDRYSLWKEIEYLKRREVWRTYRTTTPKNWLLRDAANQVFDMNRATFEAKYEQSNEKADGEDANSK